jgi:predicted dehydrogenase
MFNRYKIAVVGTGTMGQRMIEQMTNHERFSIAALYDPSERSLLAASAKAPHATAYSNIHDALNHSDLDCVYIAAPPSSHAEYASQCFEKELPVFCEKPLAISLEDGEQMLRHAETRGALVAVNFPFASTPSLHIICNALASGSLGELQAIDISLRFRQWPRPWQEDATWLRYRREGGFTREVLSHFLFAALRITGSPMSLLRHRTVFPKVPELSETSVNATFEAAGIPVTVYAAIEGDRDDDNELRVRGTRGMMRMRDWYEGDFFRDGAWIPMEIGENPRGQTINGQLDNVVRMLSAQPHTLATLQEAFQVQSHIERLAS